MFVVWVNKIVTQQKREEKPIYVQGNNFLNSNNEQLSKNRNDTGWRHLLPSA